MAKFEIRGLDDMMQALNALEVEEVAAKMLEESVPCLLYTSDAADEL